MGFNKIPEKEGGWQMMALSLFIMCLAFFIILVSQRDFNDEKFDAVKSSLEEQFSPNVAGMMSGFSENETLDQFEVGTGKAFEELKQQFKSHLDLIAVDFDAEAKTMRFSMPVELITHDGGELRSQLKNLINDISRNVSYSPNGDFFMVLDVVLPHNSPDHIIYSAGIFLDLMLENSYVNKKLLSLSVGNVKVGYVDFYFTAHKGSIPVENGFDYINLGKKH